MAFAATALSARADSIPGATYNGVASDGAHVTFTVSSDGTLVDSYKVTYVKADTCTFVGEGDQGIWPGAPIVSGAFQYTLYDAILFKGTFTGPQSASGAFRFYDHATAATAACDTGTVSWSATTTATPPAKGKASGGGGGVRHFATRVALRKLSPTLVGGRLISSSSSCLAGRKVTLWQGSRRIASARSKAKGKFSFTRSAKVRKRKVRAVVAARTVNAGVCAAGSSTFIEA